MSTLQDWEKLVARQLKTDNIYDILVKENIEGIDIRPMYSASEAILENLPKIEESTHLVAPEQELNNENAFAFLVSDIPAGVSEKAIFFEDENLISKIDLQNRYFCLKDIFTIKEKGEGEIEKDLGEKLLQSGADRKLAIDISLHQNAGASIIQQIALALSKTKELSEIFGSEILDKIVYRIAVGSNYFFEIAKIRALKLAINQLSREYGLNTFPYIFAETSFRNKTNVDEENNLIRSTLEVASAMVAGADAVFSNDFKIGKSTGLSKEISYKQSVVLAYESIINVFNDAASGSYYIDAITEQLADKSWQLFLDLESKGGYIENLNNGVIQKMIFDHAVKEQNWIKEGKIKLIGVNLYPALEIKKPIEEPYSENKIKPVRLAEIYED